MTVDDFAVQVETTASRFRFIQAVVRLDKTRFSVKYRLIIAADLYVQVYANVRNHTIGLALICQGRRLYGRDCEDGRWHRHPADAPDTHDFSVEGALPTTIEDFLLESGQTLVAQGLI